MSGTSRLTRATGAGGPNRIPGGATFGSEFSSTGMGDLHEPSDALRPPFARPEEFEDMVGDLRRVFIGWLKKTESELRKERESIISDRKSFDEEKRKAWKAFLVEKQAEYEKLQEERRRVETESAATMKQIAVEREDARQRIVEEREQFDGEKDNWKRKMLMEREKFLQEFDAFEEERRKIRDTNIAVQTVVDLNVGGVVFETSRLTLVQQQGSFLESLLNGRHQVSRDRHGRIFIDRDSELFRILLQFLRDPSVPPCPRDSAESSAICSEASYYGLKFFPFPLVFALGGHNGVDHLNTVEVLDIAQQCWRPCSPLETARTYFGSASSQGRLYAFGGQNFDYKALCDAEQYDILRDKWVPAPALNIPRRNACGASLGNRIFALGGFDGTNILSSVEAYDPRIKNWMEVSPLMIPRSSATCSVFGESLYVFGGTTGERLRSVERFDPRANKWESLQRDMIEVRSAASSAAYLSTLFVMGGMDNGHQIHSSIESMDLHSMKWIFRRQMPQPRMDAASVVASDSILVAGGQNEEVLNSTAFYRADVDEWTEGPSMLFPRYGHSLLVSNL
ncbi:kelch-like protein 1 [Condylostylus longicornis]|uniref:kelch-like protein 1 n=1 Tax=Condylostylus longicornis TaxID=2530218 RepID=UPI00244DBE0A|nr:kelch-like protein 1 [Condylostylus longicornis]